MFTPSTAFHQSNAQQVQEYRVIAPAVQSKTVEFKRIPRQFCPHPYNAGMCNGCGASE